MRAARRTSSGCRSRTRAPTRSSSNWSGNYLPQRPSFLGTRALEDYPIAELVDYIDWTPFFATWELTGKFPAILDDAKFGAAARSLYDDAQAMLQRIAAESWFRRRVRWSASGRPMPTATTSCVYGDEARGEPIAVLHTLRQQLARREGRANVALADFVAPRASGLADYIGAFVVTAGIGEDEIAERFKRANDDYSAIMVKALADRLAEAFAERLHQRVRKEFWGYAPDETLARCRADRARNIAASARRPAIRRSPTTPRRRRCSRCSTARAGSACRLTESFAMWPGASVCGLYFSHPESHYFGVGKIERDQVEDYAKRKGWTRGGGRELAGADPQLRSARGRPRGGGVSARRTSGPFQNTNTGECPLRCPELVADFLNRVV